MSEKHKIVTYSNSYKTGEAMYSVNGPEIKCVVDYEDWGYTKETAERIAACLNACAGIPTEYLEKHGADTFDTSIEAITNQRNELLEALKILIDQYDSSGDFTMGGNLTNQGFILGRAAIAKVENEK